MSSAMQRTSRNRVSVALLALAVGCTLGLAACGSSSKSKAATASSSTVIVDQSTAVTTIDPAFTVGYGEVPIIYALYAPLFKFKEVPAAAHGTYEGDLSTSSVEPYLAKSYSFSDDDKTLTLHLRSGLKFQNGEPLDAHAVVYSLDRVIKAKSGGYSILEEEQVEPPLIKSITESNSLTVVIHYSRPAPNQLQALTIVNDGVVYDPALIEAHGGQKPGKPNEWVASHDAGYGPYLLKSYSPGSKIVLERNPNFFEKVKAKKLVFDITSDTETLLLDAKSGAADVTLGLSDEQAHSLASNSCCTVASFKDAATEELNFPDFSGNGYPEFQNQTFRQALTYAVPYEAILSKVAYGYGKLYFGEWNQAFSAYDSSIGKPREYNLAKAKKLLKASGVKTPVSFPIYVEDGDTVAKEIATIAAGSWQELGVNAKVEIVTPAQFDEVAFEKHTGMTILYDSTDVIAPAYYWAWDLQCKAAYNATGVCIPSADKLMKEVADGDFVDDQSKEQQVLNEVDEKYIENAPRVWVYSPEYVAVLKKGVTGLDVFNGYPVVDSVTVH